MTEVLANELVFVGVVRPNGPLAILQIVANDHRGIEREVTDEVIDDEIRRAGLGDAVSWTRIDPANIPTDRSDRDSWRLDEGRIVV